MRAQLDQVFAIDTCFCTPAHSNQSQKSQESHGHHLKVGSQSSPGTSLASPTPSLCVTPTHWLPLYMKYPLHLDLDCTSYRFKF